ncbi:MAG: cyanobactin biosynthesis system PatB/AcyB/McaB family protein [Pseudomonadota bacterium]|uniref:cyanobactin biosynthesis system PatB/AcyB/McaB family protein n=1 Tax=Sphingomonas sp. ERG5 TaxID=1381597 RepID=UPI00054B1B4E|nr:cyanobactin biosynthesis system PatB/AcyB/McaB family protein [Sphingomonas sp. ERG5]
MDIKPILSKPVTRPHFVDPSTCVDLMNGAQADLLSIGILLIHGANYNDPAPFVSPSYEQVMSSAFGYSGLG